MTHDVVMPQLGMTMTEGSVVQWMKAQGDEVEKGEPLFLVQTDKVEMEVESIAQGTLTELLIEAGKLVPVGTVIGRIVNKGQTPANSLPTEALQAPNGDVNHLQSMMCGKAMPEREERSQSLASPRAKALARALGVDIRSVPDHSHRGRVVEADVRRFERERAVGPVPSEPQREARRESGKGGAAAPRAAIAAKMSLSAQTVPHFYLDLLADATELKKLREGLLAGMERRAGVRLTYTDLLVKALAAAVAEHAEFNARWTSGGIESGAGVNIGIAAQGKAGLLVVVIRDADKMSLPALATVRHELVERARAGKLRAGDTEGASLTLSNLGAQRIDNFHAIINPPESAILAVGRIAPRPVVVDGAVVARQTVHLSLAVDHRLIDGAAAAAFLGTLAQLVESPYAMLLDSEGRAR